MATSVDKADTIGITRSGYAESYSVVRERELVFVATRVGHGERVADCDNVAFKAVAPCRTVALRPVQERPSVADGASACRLKA